MITNRRGFTLADMLIAAAIAAVVGTGTMSAFIMAARAQRRQGGPQQAEAAALAQQLLEAMRNRVAEAEVGAPSFLVDKEQLGTWQPDTDVVGLPPAPGGESDSILNQDAKRCYRISKVDSSCTTDCYYQAQVQVCWNATTDCQCP